MSSSVPSCPSPAAARTNVDFDAQPVCRLMAVLEMSDGHMREGALVT
jgi:hypothetical protein